MEFTDNFGQTTTHRLFAKFERNPFCRRAVPLHAACRRRRGGRCRVIFCRNAASFRRARWPKRDAAESTLDEVVGQQHLLGPGKPLRLAFESKAALDDPVGAARRRQDDAGAPDGRCFDAEFIALSAVFSGVKDIREAVRAPN
jgi:hypothetical protein